MRILLIEDDPQITTTEKTALQMRWPAIEVVAVSDGNSGVKALKEADFDAVILDLMLPDRDGFEVLREIRRFSKVPALIVSVRDSEDDRVKGLEMGADDYITKPFHARDFLARVNALLRREHDFRAEELPTSIRRSGVTLDLMTNEATLPDGTFHLSPTEARLLFYLMKDFDKTVMSTDLMRKMWGEAADINLLRTYVKRLRLRIGDEPPRLILNVSGKGYRMTSG